MDPNNSGQKFTITAVPSDLRSKEVARFKDELAIIKKDKETNDFLNTLNDEGYIYFTEKEVDELKRKDVVPNRMSLIEANDFLNVSVKLFSLGVNGAKLHEAVEHTTSINNESKEYLFNISKGVSYFNEQNENLSHNFEVLNYYPEITIEPASQGQEYPQSNQVLLNVFNDTISPIFAEGKNIVMNKVKGLIQKSGKKIAGKAAKKTLEELAKKTGSKLVKSALKKGAEYAAAAGASAAAGISTAGISLIIEAVILGITKLVKALKKFIEENKEGFIAAAAIGAGAMFGSPFLLWAGVGAFTLYISTVMVVALAAPLIKSLMFFLCLCTFIVFAYQIIFRGGFLVPDYDDLDAFNAYMAYGVMFDNPYIGVGKVANPTEASNPRKIEYTITIVARIENLTNITVSDYTCQAIKKGGTTLDCPSNVNLKIPSDAVATTSQPYTFSYTVNYGNSYQDSLVVDTITITADTPTESGVSSSGTAAVCFGDCPSDCIVVSDNAQAWPPGPRASMEQAVATLVSQYNPFVQKVCSSPSFPEVNLCYSPPDVGPWGWHVHRSDCDVLFDDDLNWGINGDMIYILAHELSHHIQSINGSYMSMYKSSGAWNEAWTNGGICTYSLTATVDYEAMAEADGLYVAIPSYGACVGGSFASKYPLNYQFARDVMFK